ncbi:hypothetical protein L6278_03425 [Candidatus Parcubacteria bacterium]|nr:hypothetical protein [Candidatus Parcubacteria bacterium]
MDTQILIQPKIQGDKVVLEIPRKILEGILRHKTTRDTQVKRKTNWNEIKKLRGAWKGMDIDPMEYQLKIRSEWDRKLDI